MAENNVPPPLRKVLDSGNAEGRRRATAPLREDVEKLLLGLKKTQKSPKNRVIELWPRMVGPKLEAHTKPYALRGKTLFVRVDDSSWAFELSTRYRGGILKKMAEGLGRDVVNDIHFKVGEL